LNEGFTVYLERRILEKVYGKSRADMEAVLGRREMEREMTDLKLSDQILHIDLRGRDPDDAVTDIPYEKGALFLKHLEQTFGRAAFDEFLKKYFDHFAFQSITTAQFEDYLKANLLTAQPRLAGSVPIAEWLYKGGIPGTAPTLRAELYEKVDEQAKAWSAGRVAATALPAKDWCTQEWLQFLTDLPDTLSAAKMRELDDAFHMTERTNSEIIFQWLLMSVRHGYERAYPRLEAFLTGQGRRKFLKPLYEELVKTPEGRQRAMRIYAKARPTYHSISVATIDDIFKKS
jgi:hypothetical protein